MARRNAGPIDDSAHVAMEKREERIMNEIPADWRQEFETMGEREVAIGIARATFVRPGQEAAAKRWLAEKKAKSRQKLVPTDNRQRTKTNRLAVVGAAIAAIIAALLGARG